MCEFTAFFNTTTSPRTCSGSYAGWFVFPLVVGEQQVVHRVGCGNVRLRPEAVEFDLAFQTGGPIRLGDR
jgi:hypothetical protein